MPQFANPMYPILKYQGLITWNILGLLSTEFRATGERSLGKVWKFRPHSNVRFLNYSHECAFFVGLTKVFSKMEFGVAWNTGSMVISKCYQETKERDRGRLNAIKLGRAFGGGAFNKNPL